MPQEVSNEAPAVKKRPTTKRSIKTCKPSPLQLLAGMCQDGESNDAVKACNDYLRLPYRSLSKLWKPIRME